MSVIETGLVGEALHNTAGEKTDWRERFVALFCALYSLHELNV